LGETNGHLNRGESSTGFAHCPQYHASLGAIETMLRHERQALARVPIDHRQHANLLARQQDVMDEVHR